MNTHKAYVVCYEGIETNANDPEQTRQVTFDPPRRKMIASGGEHFCRQAADTYAQEHPGAEVGVEETSETDPWQWKAARW